MNSFPIVFVSFLFLISFFTDAHIVAPASITVQHLAVTPLAATGSGINISIPDTVTNYVMRPKSMHSTMRHCFESLTVLVLLLSLHNTPFTQVHMHLMPSASLHQHFVFTSYNPCNSLTPFPRWSSPSTQRVAVPS
jgi:hypothetical protein